MSLKLMDMLKNARNEYEKVTDPLEQQYYLGLPTVESELFYLMVADPIQQIRERTRRAAPKPAQRKQELAVRPAAPMQVVEAVPEKEGSIFARGWQCVKDHGLFYTIGHTFRKVGSKFQGGIQCVKDHGLGYTIKYAFSKLFR